MENTHTTYSCDRCGSVCKRQQNSNFVFLLSEEYINWARLHVNIVYRSGAHNNFKDRPVDLCKKCAVFMLEHALAGAKNGVDRNNYPIGEPRGKDRPVATND